MYHSLIVGLRCTVAIALLSGVSGAQDSSPDISQDLLRTLPVERRLGALPPVSEVGTVSRLDGTPAMMPMTAVLALVNARFYALQLDALFPVSQPHYPTDSLQRVQRVRAEAWVARLGGVPALPGTIGWQRVPFAHMASRAGNDALVQQLFNARLAEVVSVPVQRSYVLFEAIATLADPEQDSTRLAHNVVLAEHYLTQLHALPMSGYRTKNDSVSVLARQWRAEDTLAVAYGTLGDATQMLAHAERAIAVAPRLSAREQLGVLLRVYQLVVSTLASTSDGRAQITAFNAKLLEAARAAERATSTSIPTQASAPSRAASRSQVLAVQHRIDEVADFLAIFGAAAPPILAHAYLNTPDSVYQSLPRARNFADGRVHVLMFGDLNDNDRFSVLDRLQRRFPSGVEVLFITSTEGAAGPDLAEPAAEVAWLARYFLGARHLVMPIAIWAGSKKLGERGWFRPEPTPNGIPYHENMLGQSCVLIDGHGIVRAYQDISTRAHESALERRILALVAE